MYHSGAWRQADKCELTHCSAGVRSLHHAGDRVLSSIKCCSAPMMHSMYLFFLCPAI